VRRLLLIAVPALAAGALVVPAGADSVATTAPQRPDPCTVVVQGEAGDGQAVYNLPQGPNDPDLDITGFSMRLTPTDLVTTIQVPGLSARPLAGTGDVFDAHVATRSPSTTSTSFGYLRDADGGRPRASDGGVGRPLGLPAAAAPVVPTYDLTHRTVTLTVSRTSLAALLHVTPKALVLRQLRVSASVYVGGHMENFGDAVGAADFETLDGVACDRWLARKRPPATPCTVTVTDPVADEVSAVGFDDDIDITSVTVAVHGTQVTRTMRLARLQARPPLGVTHSFDGSARITGLPRGKSLDAVWAGAEVLDKDASTATSTLTKADIMRSLGLKSLTGLSIAFTHTTSTGSAGVTTDTDSAPDTPAVSLSRC